MAHYSRIDTMVRAVVLSRPKKIAICPFAEEGMMAKQILNWRYGIEETYIVDNRLAEINSDILSMEDLKEQDVEGLVVLLMIQNKEINQLLENQLLAAGKRIEIQNYLRPAWMVVSEKKLFFQSIKQRLRAERPAGEYPFIRLGKAYDGGYVLLDDFAENMKAYTFGIADDVSFEKELANRGVHVFMHDHTIPCLPETHDYFHFSRVGISHIDEPENNKLSMKTLLQRNGDLGNNRLLLKMDVEGAEWDCIESMPTEILNQFCQITFELHRLTDIDNERKIINCLDKLNLTHQVIWIHANNFGHIEKAGEGLEVPAYIEVTYVNKSLYRTESGNCSFPLSIDMPDHPGIEEYLLGNWGE